MIDMILTIIAITLLILIATIPIVQKYNKQLPTHDNPELWIEERAKQYRNIPSRPINRRYNKQRHSVQYENYNIVMHDINVENKPYT